MSNLTREEEAAITGLIGDDVAFISKLMEIPGKDRKRKKFIPWPVQEKLIRNLSGRDIVIKDAQIGCTSIILGKFTKDTITHPDTTTIIVSHEEFLTQRLLHRTQVFYDSIPDMFKPKMDHSSTYEKRYPDINSIMYIGTARSQVFGRGEPIQRLLFSEEAFYVPGAYERIMLPALQRVPEDGMVVRESTPNGEDGSFYDEVQAALRGESVFKLHALYWWENPDNAMRVGSVLITGDMRGELGEKFRYTGEERALIKAYRLSRNQIRWRRYKVKEMGDMFFQEHLESLDTCFLTVGEPYYDPHHTLMLTRDCYPAPHHGPGRSMIWFQPEDGGQYIVGVDPGMGKQTESVAQVWRWDLEHPRHEATIAGLIEPVPMAVRVMDIARHYNNALIVPEANAHGLALVAEFVRMRKQYHLRVYQRRDVVSGITGMHMGWLTTPKTKPMMMQELQRQLIDIETHDAELMRQIRGFRDIGMGKVSTIAADDYHDAACLAMVGMIGLSPDRKRGFLGSSGWSW